MVLARTGRSFVGVDAYPDMIRQAREAAKDSDFGQRFLSGDICRAKVSGRFDTVTLLGNTLAHLTLKEMDELLRVRKANVHRNTTFLMDYRDLIAMFWHGSWSSVKIQTHVVGKVVHRATKLDLERGILEMRARPSTRRWVLDWGHAIWSPFILEVLMQLHGWRLVHRSPRIAEKGAKAPLEHYVDIYRLP